MSKEKCLYAVAYKIGKANVYLRKAKKILSEVDMLNHKIEGDFHGLLQFCNEKIIQIKGMKND